jgi:hypothetical protein
MVAQLDSDIRKKMTMLASAFKQGTASKTMKRELSKRLRTVAKPLEMRMKARVLRLPSKGHPGPSMRQAIAQKTKAATRWSGDSMGVSVKQRGRGMPRNFAMAGRSFNREDGWNPTTLGGIQTHQEMRPAEWFDGETAGIRPEMQREVLRALDEAAATIASSVH